MDGWVYGLLVGWSSKAHCKQNLKWGEEIHMWDCESNVRSSWWPENKFCTHDIKQNKPTEKMRVVRCLVAYWREWLEIGVREHKVWKEQHWLSAIWEHLKKSFKPKNKLLCNNILLLQYTVFAPTEQTVIPTFGSKSNEQLQRDNACERFETILKSGRITRINILWR